MSLTITGQDRGGTDHALDGANTYQGLFVYSSTVTVENLTIQNAVARGGAGGATYNTGGGGGGAGLGGGLFVGADTAHGAPASVVTLSNVVFAHDQANGGAGAALEWSPV